MVISMHHLLAMLVNEHQNHVPVRKPIFVVPPLDLWSASSSSFPSAEHVVGEGLSTTNHEVDDDTLHPKDNNGSSNSATLPNNEELIQQLNSLFYYKLIDPTAQRLTTTTTPLTSIPFELDELSGAVYVADPMTVLLSALRHQQQQNGSTTSTTGGGEERLVYGLGITRHWLRDPPPALWAPITDRLVDPTRQLRLDVDVVVQLVDGSGSLGGPRFARTVQRFSVAEGAPPGTMVGQLELHPLSRLFSGGGDSVEYRMVNEQGHGGIFNSDPQIHPVFFRLDPVTGHVFTRRSLNAALIRRHVFVAELVAISNNITNVPTQTTITSTTIPFTTATAKARGRRRGLMGDGNSRCVVSVEASDFV